MGTKFRESNLWMEATCCHLEKAPLKRLSLGFDLRPGHRHHRVIMTFFIMSSISDVYLISRKLDDSCQARKDDKFFFVCLFTCLCAT